MSGWQKAACLIVVVLTGFASDALIIGGTAYVVFWLNHSGWWWVLGALLSSGPTMAMYKLVNVVATGRPAVFGE